MVNSPQQRAISDHRFYHYSHEHAQYLMQMIKHVESVDSDDKQMVRRMD